MPSLAHKHSSLCFIDSQVRIAFVTEDHLAQFEALASTQSLQFIVYDGDEANSRHWRQLAVADEVILPEVTPC
jgi:long-chain acyl-CoA synthetase